MGKPSGESQSLQDAQANLANVMATTGQTTAAEGQQLFGMALPGLEKAENYYGTLASGDPNAIARANAPAIQAISGKTAAAKENILKDMPRGGARTLGLEQADISQGAQESNLETGSYLSSFGSLAQLGGQNVGQGTSAIGTGMQGMNAAANQYGQLQQIDNEQKATQLGFIGSMAGSATELATMCWVAAELFGGWEAPQTVIVRRYLGAKVRYHWLGRYLYSAYLRRGYGWAEAIKTKRMWRAFASFIFNQILRKAEKEYSSGEVGR
jgi:hypothetical protein